MSGHDKRKVIVRSDSYDEASDVEYYQETDTEYLHRSGEKFSINKSDGELVELRNGKEKPPVTGQTDETPLLRREPDSRPFGKAAEQARREDRAAEEARFQRWMETQRIEREGTRRESLEPPWGYEKIPKYRRGLTLLPSLWDSRHT